MRALAWTCCCAVGLLGGACRLRGAPVAGNLTEARPSSVRLFSETSAYTAVALHEGHLHVGTANGLLRFDPRSGKYTRLTSEDGLVGDRVAALAAQSASGLWIATDKALSRYHDGAWSSFPLVQPPGAIVTAMVATSTGVWVGGKAGLGLLRDGEWQGFLPGAEVSALAADLSGKGLWVGTRGEGIHHFDGQRWSSHSPARGQPIRQVAGLTLTASGSVLAVGRSDEGECLAYFDGNAWTSYWPKPEGHLAWIQQAAAETLLGYRDRVLVLKQRARGEVPAGPVALVRRLGAQVSDNSPAPHYPAPLFYTEPFGRWLPADAVAFAPYGKATLIATRTAGLVQLEGGRLRSYHTRSLLGESMRLRMACSAEACYLPGQGGKAYRFTGTGFELLQIGDEPSLSVQAFVDEPPAGVLALHVAVDGRTIGLSRLEGQRFVGERTFHVTAPERGAEIQFVRRSPSGELWVGLRYRDAEGDLRPWGVVVLNLDGTVIPHRSTLLPDEDRVAGSLALPDDIRDVQWIGAATWVATNSGVCRIQGSQVESFTENEGLDNESTYSFLPRPEGELWVATDEGVGRLSSQVWHFDLDPTLKDATWAFLEDRETVWAGTVHGLVQRQQQQIRVWGPQEGIAGGVRDLYLDHARRLWALLVDGSVALISR